MAIIITIIASASGNSSKSSSASSGQSATTQLAGLGQTVTDRDFSFRVTAVKCGITHVSDSSGVWESTAKNEYCRVKLKVSSNATAPHSLSIGEQKLFDAKGRQFDAAFTFGLLAADSSAAAFDDDMNPGTTANVALYFDVPSGTKPTRIEFHTSAFSDGVQVALK